MECDAVDGYVSAPVVSCRLTFPDLLSLNVDCRSIMEGYDTQLLNSFFAYPSFNKKVRRLSPHFAEPGR